MTQIKDQENPCAPNVFPVAPITKQRKQCSQCWVHARTEWSVLSEAGVKTIDAARRLVQYRPGESIFRQHERSHGIYCIESGHLLLRHFDAFGEQTNFRVVKYGESLGWRSFFAERPHVATAIALTRCNVCFVPGRVINDCMTGEPALARAFLKTIALDRGPSEALMLRSPRLPVRVRFIYLLLYLRSCCASHNRLGMLVYDLPLQRQDIASMIGIRGETLSRIIHDLEKEQLASFKGRQIMVPDPEKLFGVVGIELPAEDL